MASAKSDKETVCTLRCHQLMASAQFGVIFLFYCWMIKCSLDRKNHHPTCSNSEYIGKIAFYIFSSELTFCLIFDSLIIKYRFRHKNHHPTCPNNEDDGHNSPKN